MTVVRKWSGDAVDGVDNPFSFTAGTVAPVNNGLHKPRLELTDPVIAEVRWNGMGALAQHAGRAYIQQPFFPGAGLEVILIHMRTAAAATILTVRIDENGIFKVYNSAGALLDSLGNPIGDIEYRLEWLMTAAQFFLLVYEGDSLAPYDSKVINAPFAAVDSIAFEIENKFPATNIFYDGLQINDDTGQLIGPSPSAGGGVGEADDDLFFFFEL